ncbi:hypothetical protein BD311DRAFT_478157 [Dichomitus squalens]|uniref:Secreted protein n=1 Tax=Dichomitus squalens TaxID=114155 RepID=A0A4Q9MYF4_9APHY|nr:hypothetical protein BD311DRAFT_478157 [Dichomitus squalens]
MLSHVRSRASLFLLLLHYYIACNPGMSSPLRKPSPFSSGASHSPSSSNVRRDPRTSACTHPCIFPVPVRRLSASPVHTACSPFISLAWLLNSKTV